MCTATSSPNVSPSRWCLRYGRAAASWAVTGATLMVASVFQPARRRGASRPGPTSASTRRRCDAARTIAAFGARLRQELDLEALIAELLAVVNQTMEPTSATLWL